MPALATRYIIALSISMLTKCLKSLIIYLLSKPMLLSFYIFNILNITLKSSYSLFDIFQILTKVAFVMYVIPDTHTHFLSISKAKDVESKISFSLKVNLTLNIPAETRHDSFCDKIISLARVKPIYALYKKTPYFYTRHYIAEIP